MIVWPVTVKPVAGLLVAATPLRSMAFPKLLPPIMNWTVPVGVPLPLCGVTVAVKLTLWPNTEGFCAELTLVVVRSEERRVGNGRPERGPLLFRKQLSPLYIAPTACPPTIKVPVLNAD